MKTAFYAFLLTVVGASVDAHGFLYTISIDGKSYIGNAPNRNTNPSVIRQVSDISPVKNPDVCYSASAQFILSRYGSIVSSPVVLVVNRE